MAESSWTLLCIIVFAAEIVRLADSLNIDDRHSHHAPAHQLTHDRLHEEAFLVAVVTSPATFQDRRRRLRQQWSKSMDLLGKLEAPLVIMKFAVGSEGISKVGADMVHAEQQQYGDILMLPGKDHDHEEMSFNGTSATTVKVLDGIQWAVRTYRFQYFARVGDDAYFRPDEFFRQALAGDIPRTKSVIGTFSTWSYEVGRPGLGLRNTNTFPYGMGYVLTHDVAAWIANSASMLARGFPEDGVVGAWLAGTQIQYISSDHFHDGRPEFGVYKPCTDKDLLVHHMESEADWQKIDSHGVMDC